MGYFINKLIKGEIYEVDCTRVEFIEKCGKFFHFFAYEYDMENLEYKKTDKVIPYSLKELEYMKRVQECSQIGTLQRIGKERVFVRG